LVNKRSDIMMRNKSKELRARAQRAADGGICPIASKKKKNKLGPEQISA